jgi:hypothetical protein
LFHQSLTPLFLSLNHDIDIVKQAGSELNERIHHPGPEYDQCGDYRKNFWYKDQSLFVNLGSSLKYKVLYQPPEAASANT